MALFDIQQPQFLTVYKINELSVNHRYSRSDQLVSVYFLGWNKWPLDSKASQNPNMYKCYLCLLLHGSSIY